MAIDRIIGTLLRVGELAFAAVVTGLTGEYLHNTRGQSTWSRKRFIYTIVVSSLSIFLSLLWLLPFSGAFIHWPIDIVFFGLWIAAFGLLVNFIGPLHCGSVFNWGDITQHGTCQKWKADVAFSFLSAIFWLVSALVGIWFMRKHTPRNGAIAGDGIPARRRWYRRY
ncbi:hypothetical protein VE03_01950 [Pseudogymnoascus sp. 23342-1-I1]|nr:hypothetical protein VE03_01950 [Pseudogymnoascus sp. 23342-1-I1]